MAITDPFDPAIEERLRHPIQHLYRVTVLPASGPDFTLAVDGELSVGFSLAWSPYAQASLTVKAPTDAAQRAALDGRLKTMVKVELGYAYDGATTDLAEVATLRLYDAEEDFKTHTIKLSLQGKEIEAQDATWNADWNGTTSRAGIREYIEEVLENSFNGPVTLYGIGFGYRPDLVQVADVNPNTGTNIWSIAEGVANSAGLKLWHSGGSLWNALPRYTVGSTYATMLRTGKSGTITDVKRRNSRSDFANRVEIVYPDVKDSQGRPIVGRAYLSSGPYSYLNTGAKTFSASRSGWANQASADAYARAILGTLAARGNTYTIQAAAAYWIRPGQTVPVKTSRGPYERQLVESVTFTPLNGLMTVDTIKNEDAEIS